MKLHLDLGLQEHLRLVVRNIVFTKGFSKEYKYTVYEKP
jgi:hypothetical protein